VSQQGDRQASVRAVTGTALTYEGDWEALFDQAGIPAGPFNGRMLAWINLKLSAAHTELNGAMQALADANAAFNFSSMGTFDATTTPVAPENTVAPALSGIQTQGQTLTTSNGSWTASPAPSFTYQWKRAGSDISGETSQTYVLQSADVGQAIICTVTATNTEGSASEDSNSVTPAATLTISGTPAATATVGDAYSFSPTTAGGHTPKAWGITNKPSWAAFSTSTGQLTGAPSGAEIDTDIVISVEDDDGLTASLPSFDITVSPAGAGSSFDASDANNSGFLYFTGWL
jgi:hypothetical protein